MRRTIIHRLFALTVILLLPVHSFGAEGVRYKFARSVYADEAGAGLKQPEGVACSQDRLAVADTGNARILVYSRQNGETRGGREIRLPQVIYPIRVALTSEGNLVVLDGRQRKVVRLSAGGAFLDYLDFSALPTEGEVFPAGIAVDGKDNLYLLDLLGNRVLVLGADGKFQRQIALPQEYGFITDLAVDQNGTIYLLDSVKSVIYSTGKDPAAFQPFNEKLKEEMKFSSNIMADGNGQLYVTDQNGGGIIVVNSDGTVRRLFGMGWKEGSLRYPAQLCIDTGGSLFVADRTNNRIQIFTPLK